MKKSRTRTDTSVAEDAEPREGAHTAGGDAGGTAVWWRLTELSVLLPASPAAVLLGLYHRGRGLRPRRTCTTLFRSSCPLWKQHDDL